MSMTDGSMQFYALTLDKVIDHAARWHSSAEVVTAREDGSTDRSGYAALNERSRQISTVFAELGIGAGERVATLAWNTQAHVETWYAVMGMGAVCHTLNPRLTVDTLAAMARQSGARLLVTSHDLLPMAREIAARGSAIAQILSIDGPPASADALEPMLAEAGPFANWGDFDETAPCGLCFTSGTTGAPKGVTYTHRSSFLHMLRILQTDVMAISARDAVLPVVPMFHANAWGLPFAVPAVGGKLVLPGRNSDGAHLAQLIRAEKVTIGVGVPTVWLGLVDHLDVHGGDLPSLSRVIVGGMPLTPGLMDRIERRLGVEVQTSWGMTELSPSGTVAVPGLPGRTASRSGRPAIGVDLRVVDTQGRPHAAQHETEGHLQVRGAAVVERYFGEAQAATDAQGWFATGDLARIEADGSLVITGRAKDLIKSGGEWINPAEIETIVGALPQVSLAAVIGRADPKWGERPVLIVELAADATISDDALLAPLNGRVAPWWVPDEVIRLTAMPLAPTGKIDKLQLRADLSAEVRAA
jgi:3-(methylthio)propionyl---CoA ligase